MGNNRVTKRVYDRATGYISTIRTGSAANDSETQNLEFGFDQAGNLRMRKDSTTGVNGGNGIREEFEYDKLSRLKQMRQYKPASSAGPTVVTENYTYDDFGNLLTKGTSYTDYCYVVRGGANDPCAGVASGRPHAAKRIKLGATSRDYAFDANGNITAATNSMFDTVTWNVANLPKRVSKGSKYSEFWYGANGARFKQQLYRAANDTETTIYFGALYQKMTKVSGASTTVEHTHFISAGGKLVTMAKRTGSGALWNRYTHTDHLGSIVALTNESGALVERSAFDPWGKRTSYSTWGPMTPGTYTAGGTGTGGLIDGVLSTKVGFTSHEHVEELGFVHMNGRVYDNEVGRFFSADPHIQFPFSTQGFNRYAYVGNNPLSYTDPSGFSVDKPSLGRVLSATGDVILSYGSGNVYAIAIAVILKSVGGYLQSGGNFNSFLKWMVKDSLTVTIPFHSKSSGQGSGKTLNANGGSEGSGGGGFFVWLAWGKLIRAVLIAATANSVPKGPDGKLQNAAKKPTNIAEDERPGRFHPGRPIPWDEFYAKYPEVGEMEEWAWKRSLEVKYEYMVWSYVMEGERPIVLYKTATPERRNYIDVLPEEITPPPGYKLATVWHSHPFPWGKDWASDLKRAYSRGPSRYPDDWRKGDWGLAYQNPDVLFSMRSLGNALVAPGKQEWWYYRTITITEPMWEQ